MDRVRFGRVLGKGARLAARTALEAVDAATSEPPVERQKTPAMSRAPVAKTALPPVLLVPSQLGKAARSARSGVTAPLRKASRALWHELTGSFFALFSLSFGVGAWRTRAGAVSSMPVDRYRFAAFCLLTLLFLYFAASNFVRARSKAEG